MYLKYWRKRRGLTVKGLAQKAGMSTETIIKIEKHGHIPTGKTLEKLEHSLRLEREMLFTKPEDLPEPEPANRAAEIAA